MEDLAWQYPAEPVERSAVRFCEAIARWRGKPELETVSINPILTNLGFRIALPYLSIKRNLSSTLLLMP